MKRFMSWIPRRKIKKRRDNTNCWRYCEFNENGTIENGFTKNCIYKEAKSLQIYYTDGIGGIGKDPKPDLLLLDKQIAFAEYLKR